MKSTRRVLGARTLLGVAAGMAGMSIAGAAHADRLELGADAPMLARFMATALLVSHIGGGTMGLLAGTVASLAPKGGVAHRASGKIFLWSMLVTYLVGAGVAPFLESGQRPNFVAGILSLYLLVTGVVAATRRDFRAGPLEKVGLVVALTVAAMGASFMWTAAQSASGTVDGSPPQAFIVFVAAGGLAAIGEMRVLARGRLSDSARIVRHLWRMCFSFFIASGSLFLGQPGVFPGWFNTSALPPLLAGAPLVVLALGLLKMKVTRRQAEIAAASAVSVQPSQGRAR